MHPSMNRLYEAAKAALGLTSQADLSRALNQSSQVLHNWEKRGVSKSGMLLAQQELGVNPAWISSGAAPMFVRDGATEPIRIEPSQTLAPILSWEHEDDLPPGEFVMIPRLDVRLSAGNGHEQVEIEFTQKQPQAFRTDWIRKKHLKPKALASMIASGDSMQPGIFDGDSLVVDTSQNEVIDGKVYAVWYDGGERVKRLFRLPGGGLRIQSDNQAYAAISLSGADANHVRVIGRVVHRSGDGGLG